MRGVLIDFLHGLRDDSFTGTNDFDIYEFSFWCWRVSAVHVQIDLTPAALPALNIDRTYGCPISDLDPTQRTEFDQLTLTRRGLGGDSELTDPADFSIALAVTANRTTDPDVPAHLGWSMSFIFSAYNDQFTTAGGTIDTGAKCYLMGTDPVLGTRYYREYPILGPPASVLAGSVIVEPAGYYPYVNAGGVARYDTGTGERVANP